MTDLQVFNNPEFGEIRAVEIDGAPWFVGKDVCAVFGDKNHNRSLGRVDSEDKRVVPITDSMGRTQQIIVTNESGFYTLLFAMQPQKANNDGVPDAYPIEIQERIDRLRKFKRWVTAEVLPAIRKHGAYVAPQAQVPATMEAAALQAVVQPIAAAMEALTATVQALAQRIETMEQGRGELNALPPGGAGVSSTPGVASQRRWMRTVSEKLDLLSAKYGKTHGAILSKIYKDMEEEFETVMEDERYRVMEEQGLEKCSMLTTVFFDEDLRDYFQRYVDHNLAPENRGW